MQDSATVTSDRFSKTAAHFKNRILVLGDKEMYSRQSETAGFVCKVFWINNTVSGEMRTNSYKGRKCGWNLFACLRGVVRKGTKMNPRPKTNF